MEQKAPSYEVDNNSEMNFLDIATRAIDQIIVNGNDRARYGHLIRAGYEESQVDTRSLERFFHTIENDGRFINVSDDGYYHFEPYLSEGSTVVPDISAIVRGRADCSDEVRNEILLHMESLVEKLLDIFDGCSLISIDDIGYALEVNGTTRSAFLAYIKFHPKFEMGEGFVYIKQGNENSTGMEKWHQETQCASGSSECVDNTIYAGLISPYKLAEAISNAGKYRAERGKKYSGHHQRFRQS